MKTSLLAAALFLLPTFGFAAGGISSGGGNVLYPVEPRNPVAPAAVKNLVPRAHATLLQYLRAKKGDWQAGRLPADEAADFDALFSAPRDVIGVSARTPVDIELEEPCFDFASKPVDGSIRSDEKKHGGICLSALTISRRVEPADLHAQSAALLAHEFSELIGFDEDQAVGLQAHVLRDLRGN